MQLYLFLFFFILMIKDLVAFQNFNISNIFILKKDVIFRKYLLKDNNEPCKSIMINYNLRPRRPPFLRVESDGIGVTSSIRPIFILERARARRADCAPGPGVFVLLPPVALNFMCNAVIPRDLHFSATSYVIKY